MSSAEVVDLIPDYDAPVVVTIEFRGRRFAVRDEGVSMLALMKFAKIAKRRQGSGSDDMEALAALYDLLRQCIADREWEAFEAHADAVGASAEDLMHVVGDAVKAAAERPTQPHSGSPGGPSTTGPSSAGTSSPPASSTSPVIMGDERVQRRLEEQGRPDLAEVVMMAREASTRSSQR